MEKNQSPTRLCSSCGLKKPLSAFIQISGPEGRRYGTICSTCRSKKDKEKAGTPFDEASALQLKLRIGAKEKVLIEKEQKRQFTAQKEADRTEVKKRDALSIEKIQQMDKKGIADRDRREAYLEAKKTQGFLSSRSTASTPRTQETQKTEPTVLSEKEAAVEAQIKTVTNEQEARKTAPVDFSVPFLDPQLGAKYHSPAFLQFIYGAGASGPIKRTMDQLFNKKNVAAHTPAAQEKNSSEKNEKDPLTEYIDNTWKPTSRRR